LNERRAIYRNAPQRGMISLIRNHSELILTGAMQTIERLVETTGVSLEAIASRSGLSVSRVEAIAEGRWTPSPDERAKIAAAFGVDVGEISWGHSMNPRNVRYRRFGLKEDF
jgi:transcriptional regulator with XRE-family HTH domain